MRLVFGKCLKRWRNAIVSKVNQEATVHPGRLSDRVLAKSALGDEAVMMRRLAEDASHIYLTIGAADFRKQISGLVAIVSMQFKLDSFQDTYVFNFCNKKRDSIKVLRYDKTVSILLLSY